MWTRSVAAGVALAALLLPSFAGHAGAAFAGGTTTTSAFRAAVVGAPAGLAATRSCVYATPTFVGVTFNEVSSTTWQAIDKPSGVAAGDVLVAIVSANARSDGTDASLPTPSGWTLLGSSDTSKGLARLWYRVAGSAEPASYTFTGFNSTQVTGFALAAYRSVDAAALAWAATQGTTATSTAPSVTSRGPRMLVTAWFVNAYIGTLSAPVGTERAYFDGISGWPLAMRVNEVTSAGSGASGATAVSLSAAGSSSAFTVALPGVLQSSTVSLTWTASAAPVDGYQWSRNGGAFTALAGAGTVAVSDASLAGSASASYAVRATASTWRSPVSTATVGACA